MMIEVLYCSNGFHTLRVTGAQLNKYNKCIYNPQKHNKSLYYMVFNGIERLMISANWTYLLYVLRVGNFNGRHSIEVLHKFIEYPIVKIHCVKLSSLVCCGEHSFHSIGLLLAHFPFSTNIFYEFICTLFK